jgi:hypothetical protein
MNQWTDAKIGNKIQVWVNSFLLKQRKWFLGVPLKRKDFSIVAGPSFLDAMATATDRSF